MDRERLFCLTVFPLLGTERTSSGPALAQCMMLIPLNVLLCIGIPTRTVLSGVTWHGEWNHLEKSHPLINTIGKDLILWYKQICIHLTYNSKSCQSGLSTAAAGVSQGGKKRGKTRMGVGKEQGLSCAGSSGGRNGLILPWETPRISLSVSTNTMGDFPKHTFGLFILAHKLYLPSSYSLLQFSSHCMHVCLSKCAKCFYCPEVS